MRFLSYAYRISSNFVFLALVYYSLNFLEKYQQRAIVAILVLIYAAMRAATALRSFYFFQRVEQLELEARRLAALTGDGPAASAARKQIVNDVATLRHDVVDDLLARGRCGGAVPGKRCETARLELELLDPLEEIKRTQRCRRPHRGIDQYENRDNRALLIFLQEVQAVINQRQKNKIGGDSIGIAQKSHACVPIDGKATDAPLDIATPAASPASCADVPAFGRHGRIAQFYWCARRDSNPHDVTHCHLKAARLPIPPRALGRSARNLRRIRSRPDQRRRCNKSGMEGQGPPVVV